MNKVNTCFWCGGKGYVIKYYNCGFCRGSGKYGKMEINLRNRLEKKKLKIEVIL